jgi:hypothetical protein
MNINDLITQTKGKVFSVTFTKKDGSQRRMRARLGVTAHLKGGELKFDPSDYKLRTVFDMDKEEYRFVNVATVTQFKCGRTQWRRK